MENNELLSSTLLTLNDDDLLFIDGGSYFGFISGITAAGAGACAIGAGISAIKGAEAGASLAGPYGAIAGGAIGLVAGAVTAYKNT